MKLYKGVLIESAEQAEALPEGSILLTTYGPAGRDHRGDWWVGLSKVHPNLMRDRTALVPIEAEEVWGSQDKSGGISRAHAGAEDPHATVKLHIAERAALGHPDRLVSHYVTPWEEA